MIPNQSLSERGRNGADGLIQNEMILQTTEVT